PVHLIREQEAESAASDRKPTKDGNDHAPVRDPEIMCVHDGKARQEREHAQDNRSGLIIDLSQHAYVGLWVLAQQANRCTDPHQEQNGPHKARNKCRICHSSVLEVRERLHEAFCLRLLPARAGEPMRATIDPIEKEFREYLEESGACRLRGKIKRPSLKAMKATDNSLRCAHWSLFTQQHRMK